MRYPKSGEALRMAALSGHGLALMPLFLVNEDLEAGRLCRLLPGHLDHSRSIYAVCSGQPPVSANVEAFMEFMELCFSSFPGETNGNAPFLQSVAPRPS
jgi:DNA-binding transcriptional LysR family regulator